MGNSPTIFSGRRTKLLTADGLLRSNGGINDHDGYQNFILNGHAEVDNSLWATYANAAQATPVNGTGGAPAVTFTRSITTPLAGQGSFLFTKDAVNRQGNGASYAFTINAKDKAKALSISFDYLISSGTFVAGSSSDITVWIYDVTNAVLISPSSINLLSNSTTLADKFNATFQTASNSTSYRLILHCATVSASAYVVQLKNVSVNPQTYVYGTPVTDWVAYTPTGTWVTNATYTGFWRRVGDSMEVNARVALAGAPTGTFTLNLPSGFTINTTKTPTTTVMNLGTSIGLSAAANVGGWVYYSSTTSVGISGITTSSASANSISAWSATIPATFAAANYVSLNFRVPITGWSSSVQTSDQTDIRIVNWVGAITTGTALTASVTNIPVVTNKDSHSAWSGTIYTVPVAGDYFLNVTMQMTTSQTLAVVAYVNGTATARCSNSFAFSISVGSCNLVNLKVGDQISFRSNTAVTTLASATEKFSITRISGPSAIAANESISARYFSSSTAITGTLATILYATKSWDTHGTYNAATGIWTCNSPGKYQFNCSIAMTGVFALNSILDLQAQQTGSSSQIAESKSYAGGAVTQMNTQVSDIFYCLSGDTLKVQASNTGTTPVIAATNSQNWMSIAKVGDF